VVDTGLKEASVKPVIPDLPALRRWVRPRVQRVRCAQTVGGTCQVASSTAICPNGSVVVGGRWVASSTDIVVPFAQRTGGTAYGVIGINYSGGSETITAQAICAVGPGVRSAGATQASGASFEKALAHARDQTGR
jgi:hypothetical protein